MNKTLFCLIVFAVTALPAFAADYDLFINNGRVIDPETGWASRWGSTPSTSTTATGKASRS